MRKYYLEVLVFVSGALVMVLELTGSRIIAPYVGSSIFVWSSLIGIILAALSLGYYWGGKLADRGARNKTLGIITFSAGIFIGASAVFEKSILGLLSENISDIRIIALVSCLILFAPGSVALGMVVPYTVKLKLRSLKRTGEVTGRLYALSTIGSILGTFLTGFYLISSLGSRNILFLISALALVLSFALLAKRIRVWSLFGFFVLMMTYSFPLTNNLPFLDKDTAYNRVILEEGLDPKTSRPILVLKTGILRQSAMFLDKDDDLVYEHTKYYRLAGHFNPNIKKALAIGGGGFSYPKDFLKNYPEADLDVVEIDPTITALAKKYFNLSETPRLRIVEMDGLVFLKRNTKLYDAIFMDAFGGDMSMPFHLTTKEAVSALFSGLSENGLVVLNIGSAFDGKKGKFLWAEYNTYKQLFPYVYLFGVADAKDMQKLQNIILVAVKSKEPPSLTSFDPEISKYLSHLYTGKFEYAPVLTQDFAPVEQYNLGIQKWKN